MQGRRASAQLDDGSVDLNLSGIRSEAISTRPLLELLVDPQTCGPLLISVDANIAQLLTTQLESRWTPIGRVQTR